MPGPVPVLGRLTQVERPYATHEVERGAERAFKQRQQVHVPSTRAVPHIGLVVAGMAVTASLPFLLDCQSYQ